MNDTLTHPLVRAFLSEADERSRTLPGDRRRELLADLGEHIEVALAEADPSDETAVRLVLERLGSPREIVAAALAEEGSGPAGPEPESAARTWVTLGLAAVAFPVALVPVVGWPVALIALAVGLIRLGRSAQWARPEKRQAILLLLSPVVTLFAFAALLSVVFGGLTAYAVMTAYVLSWCLPAVAAVRLARSAARLRGAVA
ncbi:DUF1700 domain-containing protein [Streptomyces sp. NBC_00536]|uniref:HAAS signaling domain-containing protein n=1 Tax=Streptomyces sp. NBC_00536 TaxID=2975769 RepID=UPI002E824339|nr:hypothetical protein [Streptomyces sp. NBC_00536]WUC82692.1 DUF1700 domain-containing protein [Streptomyces sp. NBC_00536]